MKTDPMKLNGRKIFTFLGLILFWTILAGWLLYMTSTGPDSLTIRFAITGLYSLTPFASAMIVERGAVMERLRLPEKKEWMSFFFLPVLIFVIFISIFMAIAYVFGNLLHISGFTELVATMDQLRQQLSVVTMPEYFANISLLNSIPLIYIIMITCAVIGGWTIHGFFGLGEEYGWRGFLWDELKSLGVIRANLLIGLIWGLWHTPLILLGLNYVDIVWGLPAVIIFAICMSFVLSALREKTNSVIPVAAVHGMVNSISYMSGMLFIVSNPAISGLGGIIASVIMLILGAGLWFVIFKTHKTNHN